MKTNRSFIIYDIETQTLIKKGLPIADMKVSVLGWYNSLDKEIKVVNEQDIPEFLNEVKETNLLVGFNSISFDNTIMRKYDPDRIIDTTPHFDIMKEAQKVLGHRVSLDSIARATLGSKKTGHGSKAPFLFQNGQIDELIEYLKMDVKLTKDIFVTAVKSGSLKFEEKRPPHEHIEFDTSSWLQDARNKMNGADFVEAELKRFGHPAKKIQEILEAIYTK